MHVHANDYTSFFLLSTLLDAGLPFLSLSLFLAGLRVCGLSLLRKQGARDGVSSDRSHGHWELARLICLVGWFDEGTIPLLTTLCTRKKMAG